MKAETSSALERLQADPRKENQLKFKWLDQHRADVLTVVEEKGQKLTEELLGLGKGILYAWGRGRGLAPLVKEKPEPITTQEEADPEFSLAYWRGKAEAWEEIGRLLLGYLEAKGRKGVLDGSSTTTGPVP